MEIMQTAEEKAWGEMAEISQIKNLAGMYMGKGGWGVGGGQKEVVFALESDNVCSKDALLSHIRERKRTGIPLNPCLVGRRVVPTAR